MELRREYQKIVDEFFDHEIQRPADHQDVAEEIAERCQALADQPPKELSDEEMCDVFYPSRGTILEIGRAFIAAHIAKQLEPPQPVTVRLRVCQYPAAKPMPVRADSQLPSGYKWVSDEFDSPPLLP